MTRRLFSLPEAALRWRVSEVTAGEFLADFAAAGYLEKVGRDRWRVTPRGLAIARQIGMVDDREEAA